MKTPGGGALLRLLPIPQTYRSTQLKALFCTVHFAFQSVNYLNEIAESLLSGFEPGQMNVDCERGRPQGGALQFLDFMFESTPARLRGRCCCKAAIAIVYLISNPCRKIMGTMREKTKQIDCQHFYLYANTDQ